MRLSKTLKKSLLSAAVLSLLGSGSAAAKTVCVDPDKSSCQPTIQEGIDNADAGDTVKIASGTYFENVTIDASKEGLKLKGKRSAILDAGDDGIAPSPNSGSGIFVFADGVTIEGFTLRGGSDDHIELASGVVATRVEDVASVHAGESFLASAGGGNHDTRAEGCEVSAWGGTGIDLRGNELRIEKNVMKNGGDIAIFVDGFDAIIEKNEIENTGGPGVVVSGPGAEVVKNEVKGSGGEAIWVEGRQAFVSKNKGQSNYYGVRISGTSMVVEKNEMKGTLSGGYAFQIDCTATCSEARISKNEAIDTGTSSYGFDIDAQAGGIEIEKNTSNGSAYDGIYVTLDDGGRLRKNRIKNAGQGGNDACFNLHGTFAVLEKNEATDCGGDGFKVLGSGHLLEDNRVTRAGRGGYRVRAGADGNRLEGNRAKDVAFSSYQVDDGATPANDTELVDNKSSGNPRFDLCSEGTNTSLSGNDFDYTLGLIPNNVVDCPSQ